MHEQSTCEILPFIIVMFYNRSLTVTPNTGNTWVNGIILKPHCRLLIGRDSHLDQSEAYDIS